MDTFSNITGRSGVFLEKQASRIDPLKMLKNNSKTTP